MRDYVGRLDQVLENILEHLQARGIRGIASWRSIFHQYRRLTVLRMWNDMPDRNEALNALMGIPTLATIRAWPMLELKEAIMDTQEEGKERVVAIIDEKEWIDPQSDMCKTQWAEFTVCDIRLRKDAIEMQRELQKKSIDTQMHILALL